MHTSYFTAPLSATTELKHAHCFVMSTPKVCSAAYCMPCDHYLPGFAAASYSPFSTLHTTQIHTTFLVTRQSLASAVLFYTTLPSVSPIICSGLSTSTGSSLASIHHMQYTPCWHPSHAIYALLQCMQVKLLIRLRAYWGLTCDQMVVPHWKPLQRGGTLTDTPLQYPYGATSTATSAMLV